MAILSTIEWGALGTGLAVAFIAFMQIWGKWKQDQVAKKVEATAVKVESTAKVVDVIHGLSNSAMTATKKTLAEVSAAKAVITHDPTDELAAKEALEDYLLHVVKQAKVDAKEAAE